MKIAHYDETTQKLLGWYDKDIHATIPTPNIEISNEVWQTAINENANHVNVDGTLDVIDFSTLEELQAKMIADGEALVEAHIQSLIDDYNAANGVKFAHAHSCANYKDMAGYAHRQFCIDVWDLNVAVWEAARTIQIDVIAGTIPQPTPDEFIAMLPVFSA